MAAVAKVGWRVVGLATGLAATKATRKAMDVGWNKTRGGEPPRNPAARDTQWSEAITWAVASGIALGLARLLAARGTAKMWEKATGSLPPGLERVGA